MKERFLSLAVLLILSVASFAQIQVTRFLDIPVDGFKKDIIQKLEAKGFEYDKEDGILTGEFNGEEVMLFIKTNNNRVWRIALIDKTMRDEAQIKIRYNNLFYQFMNNKRYISFDDEDQTLSEDESISYEMMVHKKQYQAVFHQMPDPDLLDASALRKDFQKGLLKEFTQEQIDKGGEKIEEAKKELLWRKIYDISSKMSVWFSICEDRGQFYIAIYYDNEYNQANGEDL